MDAPPPSPSSPPKCWFNGACSSDSSFVIKGYCSPSRFLSPRGEKRIFRIENSVEKRRNCLPRFSLTEMFSPILHAITPVSENICRIKNSFLAAGEIRFSDQRWPIVKRKDTKDWNNYESNNFLLCFSFFLSPSPPLVRKTLAFVALTLMHYASCIDRMLRKKWKKSLSLPVH